MRVRGCLKTSAVLSCGGITRRSPFRVESRNVLVLARAGHRNHYDSLFPLLLAQTSFPFLSKLRSRSRKSADFSGCLTPGIRGTASRDRPFLSRPFQVPLKKMGVGTLHHSNTRYLKNALILLYLTPPPSHTHTLADPPRVSLFQSNTQKSNPSDTLGWSILVLYEIAPGSGIRCPFPWNLKKVARTSLPRTSGTYTTYMLDLGRDKLVSELINN